MKQELISALERIATALPSKKVTAILLTEGTPTFASIYGGRHDGATYTVLSATTSPEVILGIMDHAYSKSNDYARIHNRK